MFKIIAEYLQKELHPLQSKLVRTLRVLNSKNRDELPEGGKSDTLKAAKEFGSFNNTEIDCSGVGDLCSSQVH